MSQMCSSKKSDVEEVGLPLGVADRLSPLSSSAIARYTSFLRDGSLAQHAAEFCKASGITCSNNPQLIIPPPYRNIYWAGSSKAPARPVSEQEVSDVRSKHVYFREKELVVGGQLLVSSLANSVPRRPFLPRAIASKLPFSTSSLPHLSLLLGIPSSSFLYKSMALSLQQCETQRAGEVKTCATSFEDMLQFSKSSLMSSGPIHILSSHPSSTPFPQTPTLQHIALKVPQEKSSIVCHDVMFPFSLYSCHQVPHTKVYEVSWTMSDKSVRAIAVCHMNTAGFDATHPAFAALYMKPGDGEVCHWVNEDNLVMWEAS